MARRVLSDTQHSESIAKQLSERHNGILDEVIAAVESNDIVVVGMAQNPHCGKARRALDEAGLTFTYLEYGSYFSAWSERLAIKMWSGWPQFPQVFVKGMLMGGNADLRRGLEDGSVKARLSGD